VTYNGESASQEVGGETWARGETRTITNERLIAYLSKRQGFGVSVIEDGRGSKAKPKNPTPKPTSKRKTRSKASGDAEAAPPASATSSKKTKTKAKAGGSEGSAG
jgi:hypothetical protein